MNTLLICLVILFYYSNSDAVPAAEQFYYTRYPTQLSGGFTNIPVRPADSAGYAILAEPVAPPSSSSSSSSSYPLALYNTGREYDYDEETKKV